VSKIDPSKATPQAPRLLRAGSKGAARAAAAKTKGLPAPVAAMDDEEEEPEESPESERKEQQEGADMMAQHETCRAAAEDAHKAAADAYAACKGTDSATALLAAEDAGDAAYAAHTSAKASSMALRGASPPPEAPGPGEDPSKGAPTPMAPGGQAVSPISLARALATAGGTAETQAKALAAVGMVDRLAALFGAKALEELEGLARAALADAKDAAELGAGAERAKVAEAKRAKDDAERALEAKLSAAVRARKYERAELFDVHEVAGVDASGAPVLIEHRTPKAWTREMPAKALDAMLAAKQARAGLGPIKPDTTAINVSSAVRQYGEARGYSEEQIAALAAQLPFTAARAASQETTR
jgi:hypothetical protein